MVKLPIVPLKGTHLNVIEQGGTHIRPQTIAISPLEFVGIGA